MAKNTQNTRAEFEFKHRIVGAVILIVLTIAFLPMILDGNRQQVVQDSPNESSQDKGVPSGEKKQVFVSTIRPVGQSTQTKGSPPDTVLAVLEQAPENQSADVVEGGNISATELAIERADSIESTQSANLERSVSEKPAPLPSSTTPARDQSVEGKWIIQIGLYGKNKNTRGAIAKLKQEGLRGSVTPVVLDGKQVDRVWIGPYPTRKAAEAVAKRYQKQSGEKVLVKEQ